MVEETDCRGTRVLLCLFVLAVLNQCCEVSCCTPAFLTIEHLTIEEGLTFDSFSFVSFTFAFNLFYASWHTVATVKPGWKKNKLKDPVCQAGYSAVTVAVPVSWSLLSPGWNAKSLFSEWAYLPRQQCREGRGDSHCFAGMSGAAVLDQKKSPWGSASPTLTVAGGRLLGKYCKEQGKPRGIRPWEIFPAASCRNFSHQSLIRASFMFYKWLR